MDEELKQLLMMVNAGDVMLQDIIDIATAAKQAEDEEEYHQQLQALFNTTAALMAMEGYDADPVDYKQEEVKTNRPSYLTVVK